MKLTRLQRNTAINILKANADFSELVRAAGLDPIADFQNSDLTDVDFGTADLGDFDFTGADLRRADLRRASIGGAVFHLANLEGVLWPEPVEPHSEQESNEPNLRADSGANEDVLRDSPRVNSWKPLLANLGGLNSEEMNRRQDLVHRFLKEDGADYRVYPKSNKQKSDLEQPNHGPVPWPLDVIPLFISSVDWEFIERGAIQRAKILNSILDDVYGPQELISSGMLPKEILETDPDYIAMCRGIGPVAGKRIQVLAVDLSRGEDGRWRSLQNIVESPAGIGFALENRSVISRVLPEAYNRCGVRPLDDFVATLREELSAIAVCSGEARAVLLSAGPMSRNHFEQALLASNLGIPLVEGDDLVVRDNKVFLETLSGSVPVGMILRFVDTDYCDPETLRPESVIGVRGLLQAVRAGAIVVVNSIGSSLMGSLSFTQFLPSICRYLLKEDLLLPDLETFWCGQQADLDLVFNQLDHMAIRGANKSAGLVEPVVYQELSESEKKDLRQKMLQRPWDYVGQRQSSSLVSPVWRNGGLEGQAATLRVFVVANEAGYTVMPGGYARFGSKPGAVLGYDKGAASKDSWVISNQLSLSNGAAIRNDVAAIEGDPHVGAPALNTRVPNSQITGRVADSYFWLGRYIERYRWRVLLLRTTLFWLFDRKERNAGAELGPLLHLLASNHMMPMKLASVGVSSRKILNASLKATFDPESPFSLRHIVGSMERVILELRDRLPSRTWQMVNDIELLGRRPQSRIRAAELLKVLDGMQACLSAMPGIEEENMALDSSWHFFSVGSHLERALSLCEAVWYVIFAQQTTTDEADEDRIVEVTMRIFEISPEYQSPGIRENRRGEFQNVLVFDKNNDFSLITQLIKLKDELAKLVGALQLNASVRDGLMSALHDIGVEISTLDQLDSPIVDPPAKAWLGKLVDRLMATSDLLTKSLTYSQFRKED